MGRVAETTAPRAARGFIGRERELETLATLARDGGRVAWIVGPGGVGKTALLREFTRRLAAGHAHVWVDRAPARPSAIVASAVEELGLPRVQRLGDLLAQGVVLVIDELERVPTLEGWIADELARVPPAAGLLIVASRGAPGRDWLDPSLSARVHVVSVGNFDRAESHRYLAFRRVRVARRDELAAYTRGHPLALALAAESPDRPMLDPEAPQPELVRRLLDGLVDRTISAAEREALECIAIVPALNEALLSHLLGAPASEPFAWLRQRPYVRATRDGLVLHELVRDALVLDQSWREPDRAQARRAAAMEFYARSLEEGRGDPWERARALGWLFSQLPEVRRTFQTASEDLHLDELRRTDLDAVAQIVESVDGPETRRVWESSLALQPAAATVARDARRKVAGMWLELVVGDGYELSAIDPATRIVSLAARRLGLSGLARGSVQRLQLDASVGRELGPTIHLRVAHDARVLLTTPGLAARWIVAPAELRWAKVWERRGYVRLEESFVLDGRTCAIWQLDLRGDRAAAYVRAAFAGAGTVASRQERPLDLSAVREALELAVDPAGFSSAALAGWPVLAAEPATERAERFRAIVRSELDAMAHTLRGEKWRRAIVETYLVLPRRAQEDVAEHLGLPFRTYRDHLTAGLVELVRRLALRR